MAESAVVACPGCVKRFKVASEKLGRTFKCPACQTSFQAVAISTGTVAPSSSKPAARTPTEVPVSLKPSAASPAAPAVVIPPARVATKPLRSKAALFSLILALVLLLPVGAVAAVAFRRIGFPRIDPGQMKTIVFGLTFVLPTLLGLAAALGLVGVIATLRGKARGTGMAVTGIVIGLGGIAVTVLYGLPGFNAGRHMVSRVQSMSNLHQIGMAIFVYQARHNGQFPPDIPTLVRSNPNLRPDQFVEPDGTDTPASDPSQISGNHLSYVYTAAGKTETQPPPGGVVLYEKPTDHPGTDPLNALTTDGSVQQYSDAALKRILAEK